MRRLGMVLALLALPAACASVLGVGSDTYQPAVDHLCACPGVPERVGAAGKTACIEALKKLFDGATDVEEQLWIEASSKGCGSSCSTVEVCFDTPPLCSLGECGPTLPPCCSTAGSCSGGVCSE